MTSLDAVRAATAARWYAVLHHHRLAARVAVVEAWDAEPLTVEHWQHVRALVEAVTTAREEMGPEPSLERLGVMGGRQ